MQAVKWERMQELPMRRIVGLMSGTSVDGIDAALVEITGSGAALQLRQILATLTIPYESTLRNRIHQLFDGHVADVCEMNFVLGETFAEAALKVISAAHLRPQDVHLIGSHGQTVYHIPRGSARTASTLQIGEPAVIAERTGVTTVADFRVRDIAAGGEGAPLVPYVDWVLCRRPGDTIVLQNIGGIANLTVVTPDLEEVRAFDTGPGNMVIDAAVALMTDGVETFDRDGHIAGVGTVDQALLQSLLSDPFLHQAPPKSTGREHWGAQWVQQVVQREHLKPGACVVATLTEFVARSIADAYEKFVFPVVSPSAVFISGGGANNPVLMRRLGDLLGPVPVHDSSSLGLPVDSKEAIAFAVLANETVCGEPANVLGATGARGRRILGKIIPA